MNLKLITLLVASTVFSTANAQFEVKELGLNDGGNAKNVFVVPKDIPTDLGKYSFSYDIDEIVYNHQYDAAKHVIDRLSWANQTKIYAFWNNALVEKKLTPRSIPEGSVTLANILLKSKFNTDIVNNREDFDAFIRSQYTKKLNDIIPVVIRAKRGNFLDFDIINYSDFKISSIKGNVRVVDTQDNRIYIDDNVSVSISLPFNTSGVFTLNKPLRLEEWKARTENVAYKFTVTSVKFSNGTVFNADEYYFKIKNSKPKINPFPFTQISEN